MTIPAVVITGAFELAKLGLQTYFQYMRVAGKTDAEIEQTYQAEKAAFAERSPENLPPVPPDTD
jgi:hypothetical protein